jgi:hypothetical protein
MKRIIPVILLVASGFTFAACGNSAQSQHSKSYNAGVAWVRDGFPGTNETSCFTSVLVQGQNCTQSNSFCGSNGAVLTVVNGNYNMQQWINGCLSVPVKHWPKWYQKLVFSGNS